MFNLFGRVPAKELKIKVRIFVEPDEDSFHAFCPELKGVHVSGDSEQEALENCQIAIDQHIHTILKYGDPIPIGCIDEETTYEALPAPEKQPRQQNIPHSYIRELSISA
ncbi:MAG: type II toxin-antitoxin system HicB family antitoxin [Gammaproteobacteria bacterium]|nr:type II toxin-antitoxin system HicB family antitoxin [Gammaproteobacteria bacterium]